MKKTSLADSELRIANLLRRGVLLAGLLLFLGWMSFLDFTQNPLAAFKDYQRQSLAESLQRAWQHQDFGLLIAYAGLGLLISLPLIRVLMTGVLFALQKERILATMAFLVFAALLLSFTLGLEL